jgi:uncharacterized protein YejL (UPF0352 family)
MEVSFLNSKNVCNFLHLNFSADLTEWQQFEKDNKMMRYALMVLDNFSKFVFIEPLPNKQSSTVAKAFEKILKESKRRPKFLHTDGGYEEE